MAQFNVSLISTAIETPHGAQGTHISWKETNRAGSENRSILRRNTIQTSPRLAREARTLNMGTG